MRRGALLLGLLAGLLFAAAPAVAQGDGHRHEGFLFQIRYTPELNRDVLYRAFLPDRGDPASLIVERGHGYSGDARQVDLSPARCPALGHALRALAELPLPAPYLDEPAPYDMRGPRGDQYDFGGFVRFPNGGEGEVSFMAYDVPGRPRDPQLEWMRGLVLAFDGCVPRGPQAD